MTKIKKSAHPKILFILPTLGKRLDLLRESLQSIQNQKKELVDLIVVCPLKNKAAVSLSKKMGALVIDDPGTLSGALNAGIASAKPYHEYIGWMGDDDILAPDSLVISSSALDSRVNAVAAFGYCNYINDKGNLIFTSRAGNLAPWIMTWGPDLVPLPGSLLRLSALEKVGVYDTTLSYAMDLDMFLRLRQYGKFINTKTVLASFRWHPTSTTVANRTASTNEAELVKRRYLSTFMRKIAPVWEHPVRFASYLAALRVNSIAKRQIDN